MGRTSAAPKIHACPYCDRKYSSPNSVYNHTRSAHGKRFTVKTIEDNVQDNTEIMENKLRNAKQMFLDDLISAEQYEKLKQSILDKYSEVTSNKQTLDIKRVLESDTEYMIDYLKQQDMEELISLAEKHQYSLLFDKVVKSQIKFDNGNIIVGKELIPYDGNDLYKIYRLISNALLAIVNERILSSIDESDESVDSKLEDSRKYQTIFGNIGDSFSSSVKPHIIDALNRIIP